MLIEARGLRRTFQSYERRRGLRGALRDLLRPRGEEHVAVEGLDLRVDHGELVGFIGPNGAGKSTTLKMLTGVLAPTSGELRVAGLRPLEDRPRHVRNLGVVWGQRTQLWWDLAVIEAFDLLAAVFQVSSADYQARLALLDEELGLRPLLGRPVRELSLGQRMRCDLAAALLHGPPLLLLDEPTIGLDVGVKRRIRGLLRRLHQEQGVTILLTTHDLAEVEALCTRVLLLDRGRLLFDGPLPGLRDALGSTRRLRIELEEERPAAELRRALLGLPVEAVGLGEAPCATLQLRFARGAIAPAALIAHLGERLPLRDLAVEEEPIEELVSRFYEEPSA